MSSSAVSSQSVQTKNNLQTEQSWLKTHGKTILAVFRWLCLLPYPYFLTHLANCLSAYDPQAVSTLLEHRPGAFYFGLFITYILFFAFSFLTVRPWLAGLFLGFLYTTLPLIDYFKFSILQEHLFPWDLLLVKNAVDFEPFLADLPITGTMFLLFFAPVAYSLLLLPRKPNLTINRKFWAIPVVFGAFLCMGCNFFLTNNAMRMQYTTWFDISVNDTSTQESNYYKNGFLAAFALNIGYLHVETPAQYQKSTVEQFKEIYAPQTALSPNWKQPDVIVILSESFWDVTTLPNTTFSQDPLANYRALSETCPSGTMISSTFGGGTARPEFEVLTGMTTSQMPVGAFPYQQYMQKDTFSFARYFKELGYDTIGLHTYDNTFYERDKAYLLMGFDEFRGENQLKTDLWWNSGPYLTDETLIDEITYELEQPHPDGLFLFGITMENHSMFYDKFDAEELTIDVSNNSLSSEEINALENFAKGVSDSDAALKQLYDYVMARDKETVVLWFGDHLPTLGTDFAPYTTTGKLHTNSTEAWTEEEIEYMFSTSYIAFANYDTGTDYRADKKAVTSSLLLPLLLEYIQAPETIQSNFLLDLYETCPIFNTKYNLYKPNTDPEKTKTMLQQHWLITYDQLLGKNYINS